MTAALQIPPSVFPPSRVAERQFHVTAIDSDTARVLLADLFQAPSLISAYAVARIHLTDVIGIPVSALNNGRVRITCVSEQPAR